MVQKTKGVVRTSKSGLDIPSDIEDRFIQGVIVSSSETGKKDFGLKDGDVVLYDKHAGNTFKGADGEEYKVIYCRDVAVVL